MYTIIVHTYTSTAFHFIFHPASPAMGWDGIRYHLSNERHRTVIFLPVSEWCYHKSRGISEVLVPVAELCVTDVGKAILLCLVPPLTQIQTKVFAPITKLIQIYVDHFFIFTSWTTRCGKGPVSELGLPHEGKRRLDLVQNHLAHDIS